jgi:hypothetical protein
MSLGAYTGRFEDSAVVAEEMQCLTQLTETFRIKNVTPCEVTKVKEGTQRADHIVRYISFDRWEINLETMASATTTQQIRQMHLHQSFRVIARPLFKPTTLAKSPKTREGRNNGNPGTTFKIHESSFEAVQPLPSVNLAHDFLGFLLRIR